MNDVTHRGVSRDNLCGGWYAELLRPGDATLLDGIVRVAAAADEVMEANPGTG